MKILHLRSSGGFFGAEAVIYNMSQALPASYQQEIMLLDNGSAAFKDFQQRLKMIKIAPEILQMRGRFDRSAIRRLSRWVEEHQIDVLHCHDYKADFLGYSVKKRNPRLKIVATMHGWTKQNFKVQVYEWLDARFVRKFNRVIAVSADVARQLTAAKIPIPLIQVIPNAIDTRAYANRPFDKQLARKLGVKENQLILGAIGRLSPEKGLLDLIKALPAVKRYFPNVKLLIVGDGPERKLLDRVARELNITGNIKFLGIRSDIPQLLTLFTIFIMPSHREGTPMALLEAMASSRPIIATNVGGIPKLIQSGYSGILVPAKSPDTISKNIIELGHQLERQKMLGGYAKETVNENYSLVRLGRQMTEFYETLIKS
jgi:glycosyltransferase involved in cell wall biosynthesis